ncbi:hypothetical protein BVRB_8g181750 [Beta vulgaris subsp. vulgaris]|nr:hypothetical protein BVRB_8g181750 [Beta vulgaris subsp. vulgaris]
MSKCEESISMSRPCEEKFPNIADGLSRMKRCRGRR